MQVSVSLYQQKRRSLIRMTPVCAGLFGWTTVARDAGKAKERSLDRIRRELQKVSPRDFLKLMVPPGRKLDRVHGELTLKSDGEKRKVAGWFPVVSELRRVDGENEIRIAFHPLSPLEWFLIDAERDFAEQVLEAYARILPPGDELEEYRSDGNEKLLLSRFDAAPPSLLSLLSNDKEAGTLAGVGASGRLEDLLRVSVNETARAAEGRLARGLRRPLLGKRLSELLCGVEKSPVLLVGPPGSGKSFLIADLVYDLLEADDFPFHRNLDRCHGVIRLSGRHLIAGMSYVGQWEARAVALLERAKKRRWLLWVEDLFAWGNIGRTIGSERSLADFFRAPVARRDIGFIGECTAEQATLLEQEAPAFAAAFTRVAVEPATSNEVFAMLLHESRRLEKHHRVEIDPRCFRRILDLGHALGSGSEPGRSLRALTSVVRDAASRAPEAESWETRAQVEPGQITQFFAEQTGLPDLLLATDPPLSADTLRRELGQQILGQPEALEAVIDLILGIRAGLTARGRPYGVYLFTGPTGTGKTELAKCIAEYLFGDPSRLLRFDMGEHGGPEAVSRLMGDRFEPDGTLTRALRAQPFSLVLLDEIEKGHPSVLNLMLQVFDDGRLTDARGRVVDFSHSVIVMTSNLGAGKKSVRGFAEDPERVTADVARAVADFFPPELFNRIDRVVPFAPLCERTAFDIAKKELAKLAARPGLSERNIYVRYTDAVVEGVVRHGFSAEWGARSLKRYIDREIGDELARALTRERSAEMRLYRLYRHSSGVAVHAESLREAESLSGGDHPLRALLDPGAPGLSEFLTSALEQLGELERSGRIEALAGDISRELAEFRRGEVSDVDRLFSLDALAAHVKSLADRLARRIPQDPALQAEQRTEKRLRGETLTGEDYTTLADDFGRRIEPELPHMRRPSRQLGVGDPSHERLISDLVELAFLESLLRGRGEADRHAVRIDITRLALHRESRRFSQGNPGLAEWLARAYAKARGRLDSAALSFDDGELATARSLPELFELFERRPRQISMALYGPGVTDFFAGEAGCHVRRSRGVGPEIVRVDVVPGGRDPARHLAEHAARLRAFEAALEGEGELPDNPEAIAPVVRSVELDLTSVPSLASVLDFRHSHVVEERVRELGDALLPFFWLGMVTRGRTGATT